MSDRDISKAEEQRAYERAYADVNRPLTLEALEQNPWYSLALDLPHETNLELLVETEQAATELRALADRFANEASVEAERDHWLDVSNLADARIEELSVAKDVAVGRAAWQEEEFSRATIAFDPWTAVYLPIPERAEAELLISARAWASDLQRYAEGNGAFAAPFIEPERFSREQNLAAAAARVAEIDARLERTPGAIGDIPSNAPLLEEILPDIGLASIAPVTLEAINENEFGISAPAPMVVTIEDHQAGKSFSVDLNTPDGEAFVTKVAEQIETFLTKQAERTGVNDERSLDATVEDVQAALHGAVGKAATGKIVDKVVEPLSREPEHSDNAFTRNDTSQAAANLITLEAIEHDPETVIDLGLPENAPRELVARVADLAWDLQEKYAALGQAAGTADDRERFFDRAELARQAQSTAEFELGWMDHRQAAEREPEKAKLVDEILARMGDMHSHYDIAVRGGDYVLVRSFEIDDDMLAEYGLRDSEQEHGRTGTIEALHDWLIATEGRRLGLAPEGVAIDELAAQRGRDGDFGSAKATEMEQDVFAKAGFDATERDAELREAWAAPVFSQKTIEADPWTAVYLGIPAGADIWLLMKAYDAAMQCQETIVRDPDAGPRLRQGEDGPAENLERAAARADQIADRIDRIREAAQPEPIVRRDPPSPPPAPGVMPEREPVTREAIARDPWNAVALDMPEDASRELLSLIATTAHEVRDSLVGRAQQSLRPDEAVEWWSLAVEARDRQKDAEARLVELEPQRNAERDRSEETVAVEPRRPGDVFAAELAAAWRAPAFSHQTMETDPWTAVYLPIPEGAEKALLEEARFVAGTLCPLLDLGPANRPREEAPFTSDHDLRQAEARAAELAERVRAIGPEQEPAQQINGAQPSEKSKTEVVEEILVRMGDAHSHVDIVPIDDGFALIRSRDLPAHLLPDGVAAEQSLAWRGSLDEMHELVIAQERGRADSGFLSPGFMARSASEHAARTVDLVLGEALGYLVDEPVLTPEQARLQVLAYAERGEALEIEMARREGAAALDYVNSEINRNRPRLPDGDLPARPDSIYERYPGILTQDDSRDGAQEREEERAIYDTGIERSR